MGAFGAIATWKRRPQTAICSRLVDRGADALVASGRITLEATNALKAEARRRSDAGEFFGHIAYASLIAQKLALTERHRVRTTRNTIVGTIGNVSSFAVSRRQAITVALGLAILLLLGARWLDRSETTSAPAAAPVRVRAGPALRPKLVVDVAGAVRRPGLYRLRDGSRVADAIERAGGATSKAFLEALNLAAPLADGQQVLVPRKAATGGAMPATATGPVSLSAATLEQLDTLPGVGPVTAQKILDYRAAHGAFRSVEELDAVSGIGPATVEELRELVVP